MTPSMPKLPFLLSPELRELESRVLLLNDRAAGIRIRVDRLRGEYQDALAERSAAAAEILEGEALDEPTAAAEKRRRTAEAEIARLAALLEAAGGASERAEVEVAGPRRQLEKALEAFLGGRLAEAEAEFDAHARAAAERLPSIFSLRAALRRDLPKLRLPSLAEPGEVTIEGGIRLDEEIEDEIARALSLVRVERAAGPSVAPASHLMPSSSPALAERTASLSSLTPATDRIAASAPGPGILDRIMGRGR